MGIGVAVVEAGIALVVVIPRNLLMLAEAEEVVGEAAAVRACEDLAAGVLRVVDRSVAIPGHQVNGRNLFQRQIFSFQLSFSSCYRLGPSCKPHRRYLRSP